MLNMIQNDEKASQNENLNKVAWAMMQAGAENPAGEESRSALISPDKEGERQSVIRALPEEYSLGAFLGE